MTSHFLVPLLGILLLWILTTIATQAFTRPAEPAEPPPGDEPRVPARLRPRPKLGAIALALAEPDDEEDNRVSAVSHTPVYPG